MPLANNIESGDTNKQVLANTRISHRDLGFMNLRKSGL